MDNARIEMEGGNEVPVIDGSALGWLVALEETSKLLARRKRNVQMRFSGAAPRLDGVRGVSAVECNGGGPEGPHYLRCRVDGDMGPFLAAISGAVVDDLTIEPARLEEAFLEFYEPSTSFGPGAERR